MTDPVSGLALRQEKLLHRIQELETQLQNVVTTLARRNENESARHLGALYQAIGLLTTLHPTLQIDIDNPIEMAREIHRYVTAQMRPAPAQMQKTATSPIVDNTLAAYSVVEQLTELATFMGPFNDDERARPTHAVWQDRAEALAARLRVCIHQVGPLPYATVRRD